MAATCSCRWLSAGRTQYPLTMFTPIYLYHVHTYVYTMFTSMFTPCSHLYLHHVHTYVYTMFTPMFTPCSHLCLQHVHTYVYTMFTPMFIPCSHLCLHHVHTYIYTMVTPMFTPCSHLCLHLNLLNFEVFVLLILGIRCPISFTRQICFLRSKLNKVQILDNNFRQKRRT